MDLAKGLLNLTIGGNFWILLFLIFLSILSVTFIIERLIIFRRWERDSKALIREAELSLKNNRKDGLIELSKKKTPLTFLLQRALEGEKEEGRLKDSLEREKIWLKLFLEKRLTFLGTLGANAPFIGLLGTVIGIMHAFRELAEKAEGGSSVMVGISEALVATALGLFVAIPCAISFNFFRRKVNNILSLSDVLTNLLVEYGVKSDKR